MKYEKINLFKITRQQVGKETTLELYLCQDTSEIDFRPRPAVLVIPGGGYRFCSIREAEPVALRYMSEGFNCFVLNYSCNKPFPLPQFEVAVAMKYINEHASEFNIIQNAISLIGFSAGGHLAGSYGYLYKDFTKELKCSVHSLKPFSIVLGYPVITSGEGVHIRSLEIITDNFRTDLVEKLSVEKFVTKNYPPTFIWTTKQDTCVNPINAEKMEKALKEKGVSYRYILYENGQHGGSLFNRGVYNKDSKQHVVYKNQEWVNESVRFIFDLIENKANI